jgi:hypothetical protein
MRSARTEASTGVLGWRRVARYAKPLAWLSVRCACAPAVLVRDFERVANQPMAAANAPVIEALLPSLTASIPSRRSRSARCPARRTRWNWSTRHRSCAGKLGMCARMRRLGSSTKPYLHEPIRTVSAGAKAGLAPPLAMNCQTARKPSQTPNPSVLLPSSFTQPQRRRGEKTGRVTPANALRWMTGRRHRGSGRLAG